MNEKQLIEQLHSIKVKPDKNWEDRTLRLLEINVKTQHSANRKLRSYYFNLAYKNIMGGIITLIIAVLLAGGTAVASDAARPGDLFYPVDTFMEQVQRSFTSDPQALADLEINIMQERVREMEQLKTENNMGGLETALAEMNTQAERIQERVEALNQLREENKIQTQDQQQIMQKLQDQLQQHLEVMNQLQTQLQEQNGEDSQKAQQQLQQVQTSFQQGLQESINQFQNETGVQLEFNNEQQQQNQGTEDQIQNQNQNQNQVNPSGNSNDNGEQNGKN
jgi:hypothetical protein